MKVLMLLLMGSIMGVFSVYAEEKEHNEQEKHKQKIEKVDMQRGEVKKDEKDTDIIGKFKKDPEYFISKIKDIKIEAYQFGYSPERIVVKKGDIVRLTAISRDVKHGLRIKDYDINIVVKKDESQKIEFVANKSGKFDIICSVYCGKGHRTMRALLIVEDDRDKEKKDSKEKK